MPLLLQKTAFYEEPGMPTTPFFQIDAFASEAFKGTTEGGEFLDEEVDEDDEQKQPATVLTMKGCRARPEFGGWYFSFWAAQAGSR